jgi:O-antigen/teichoic acid export membrane protein
VTIPLVRSVWRGTDLNARLIRSSGVVGIGFAISQATRLGGNLVLTRLLFPEAFGLMALITVFIAGLTMLSDVGVTPSIQHSKRGDDPNYLNTAWTIQVTRGLVLFVASCLLGSVAVWIYGDPRLQFMLPVAGLSLLIAGFNPTRIDTASRHLLLGRVTTLEVVTQFLSLVAMIALTLILKTVWALVIGGVIAALIRLVIMDRFLPGPRNRFRWDVTAAWELIHFGKWIFLSTLCGFVLIQGDKAIFGKYLSLEMLGIYNIGFFMGGVAQAMTSRIMAQVMIPLHRTSPPSKSAENYTMIRKSRFMMTTLVFFLQFLLAFGGFWMMGVLYDDRFVLSGAVVVAVACMNVPFLIGMTYEFAAYGQGDSRSVFNLLLAKATTQALMLFIGMQYYGLLGAFVGLWLSQILVHPLVVRLARRHGAWDAWHDLIFASIGLSLTALVVWSHWDVLLSLRSIVMLNQ